MTTEGITVQSPAPAIATSSEPSQPVPSTLPPSQQENEAVAVEKARAGAHVDYPEAPNPKPPVAPSTESSVDKAVAASEPEAPIDAQVEEAKAQPKAENEEPKKDEPQVGEKRNLDSTTAPAAAPTSVTEDKKEPVPAETEEPGVKKQKLDANTESSQEAKEPAEPTPAAPAPAAAADDTNGNSKKQAGRPKKEKVKDAIKKAIPGDGIGSRTRSRTKAT